MSDSSPDATDLKKDFILLGQGAGLGLVGGAVAATWGAPVPALILLGGVVTFVSMLAESVVIRRGPA